VRIAAIDDSGHRFDGLTLDIAADAVAEISSSDLEMGNPDIGLTGSTGAGQGDWRLELESDLFIEPRAYVETGGFLTAMHTRRRGGAAGTWWRHSTREETKTRSAG